LANKIKKTNLGRSRADPSGNGNC